MKGDAVDSSLGKVMIPLRIGRSRLFLLGGFEARVPPADFRDRQNLGETCFPQAWQTIQATWISALKRQKKSALLDMIRKHRPWAIQDRAGYPQAPRSSGTRS